MPTMEQRVSMITLGVTDLDRARTFYQRLGWRGRTLQDTVFFQAGGMLLVLWGRRELADDAGAGDARQAGFGGITLAHNVRSASEVGALLGLAEGAGATVTRPAAPTFYGGYAGYFADPDGHLWEVAHNPGLPMGDDGTVGLPDGGS